ncbi:MAG: type-F conjugative transfer system pilin assembly protein TrbC [Candidatus Paracaedibacteraceae bacterium]|nr:type-F conjugative transfer system pilin assembly protein TrbC [Candidatus Paracaedibacteraceae bacterium]
MLSTVILALSTFSIASTPPTLGKDMKGLQENPAYQAGLDWATTMTHKTAKGPHKPCCQAELLYKKAISDLKTMSHSQSDQILIFISFSMPEASLKALADSITFSGQKVTLVLRGLVENSFKKTALKIKELKTEMEINPQSFEAYKITQVPTFIMLREGKETARLSGNVTLSFAATKLREAA